MLIEKDFDVKKLTSFKCGGKISTVVFPESVDEFVDALKSNPDAQVFGNFTNTLVSSDGYDGTVILTAKMDKFLIDGNFVTAECGLKGPKLSQAVAEKGLSGLEFMVAFPGSIGGECFMNAGAHGQSISDCFVEALCYNKEKGLITLSKEDMKFSYRTSIAQAEDLVILQAKFELRRAKKEEIEAKMQENLEFRKSHQPSLALPNCGSVFRNPEGDSAGRLLELSGAKDFSYGNARVWENHANFIINDGGTSFDILSVMAKMKNAVWENFGIELRTEVRFLGGDNTIEDELCKNLKIK